MHSGLNKIKKIIEERLGMRVTKFLPVKKKYSSTSDTFFVMALDKEKDKKTYFLKFNREKSTDNEIEGGTFIGDVINTPRIILSSDCLEKSGDKWIIFEYVHGFLMSEKFIALKDNKESRDLFAYEELKEKELRKLHSHKAKRISYQEYINTRANQLFYHRLTGNKYNKFYGPGRSNISSLFDRVISVNGNKLPLTINQIISNIKEKYNTTKTKKVLAIKGHGDAHHGNIIINDKIWFIDNEYSDHITPFMELAKPYYNDLIGVLFFHDPVTLNKFFKITKYVEKDGEIIINMDIPKKIVNFLEITKIKLLARKDTIKRDSEDFLSLNDYLVLCHILTKNPNNYSPKVQKLFIVFAVLLACFDPFKPETIYDYLEPR